MPGLIIDLDAIKAIYTDSSALVISAGGVDTEPFEIVAGVLQWSIPLHLCGLVDYIMRHVLKDINQSTGIVLKRRKCRRHPELRLHDLDFADDIALLSSSIEPADQ